MKEFTKKDMEKIAEALKRCGKDYIVVNMKNFPHCNTINKKTKKLILGCPPNDTIH